MITYNTFTWVTAIAGVLFYVLIRKDKAVYEKDDIAVEVSCRRMFEKLSNIHFVPEMNPRILRVDLLFETDDEALTRTRYRAHEIVPYVGEISFEVDQVSHPHNYTIQLRSDVWYGYLRLFVQWELTEVSRTQCRGKQTQIVLVPLVVKSFVEKQVYATRADSLRLMKTLLEAGSAS